MVKRILYSACGFDGGSSGISVYMRETLVRLARNARLTVVATHADAPGLPESDNIRYVVLWKFFDRPLWNMLFHLFIFPFLFSPKKFDFLLLPAGNRRAVWFKRMFTVAVVHDLSQFHVPAKYDRFRMFYVRQLLPAAVRKADRVVAISCSTARDLEQFWKIPAGKITVNYNGFDASSFHDGIPAAAVEAVRSKFSLPEKFLLYVSRIEHPGKNHLRLVQAFEKLPEEIRGSRFLVFGGKPWNGAEPVLDYIAGSPLRDRIRLIGFVPSEALPALYAAAELYVFPSLFEGFGLSVPEAMAVGTVVACSNNSSLGEIAGDAALTFDPESVPDMTRALCTGLGDGVLRDELRRRGFERAKLFSWDRHVETLLSVADSRFAPENRVLGVRYDNVSMAGALEKIGQAVDSGVRRKIAFVNADCLNQACRNRRYRELLAGFDQVWPDGSGMALAGRILGSPVRENVNGTDLLPQLCELAGRRGFSIGLYGARPGVAERMKANLLVRYPALRIAGVRDGYSPGDAAAEVAAFHADILLVALGVPRQEEFIAANFDRLGCKVAIGVGGLFDFFSGDMPRAPQWLRKLGMEWSFRLAMEPRRMFKRYVIGNPLFVWRVLRYGEGYHE